jgi:K(+)-stimulated pyrophosphate-energized sodium pump
MMDYLGNPLYWVPLAGLLALLFALEKTRQIGKADPGDERLVKLASHLRAGVMAFLRREFGVVAILVLVVASLLALGNTGLADSHGLLGISFAAGAGCAALTLTIGLRVAMIATLRSAAASRTSVAEAHRIAFSGGTVMGMAVTGLGVLGIGLLFLLYTDGHLLTPREPASWSGTDWKRMLSVLTGFSLGASCIALFARVGGGIYAKAADVAASQVGRLETEIAEDDQPKPATIAAQVGDQVGDVAGMGADLFDSYVGSIIATMVLGWALYAGPVSGDASAIPFGLPEPLHFVTLPLFLAMAGIAASLVGTLFVRPREARSFSKTLRTGTMVSAVLMSAASWLVIDNLTRGWYLRWDEGALTPTLSMGTRVFIDEGYTLIEANLGIFRAVLVGLITGALIGFVAEYFTSARYRPVKRIAAQSKDGAAPNLIAGTTNALLSTLVPVLLVAVAVMVAFQLAGLYGIAVAALGMLSTTGILLATDASGPIADSGGEIAERSGPPEEVRDGTGRLDSIGSPTAALGKGVATGSAALTSLALFSAFSQQIGLGRLDVLHPPVLVGILVGAGLPFVFSGLVMLAVGRAAGTLSEEVRRQLHDVASGRQGTTLAQVERCVDLSTAAAIRGLLLPGLTAIAVPLVVGFISSEALGGLLVGVTVSGVPLAIYQSNAGRAWQSAKKFIEAGAHGGKGSAAHQAAVTGDRVGDSLKDAAGPSLHILIKLICIVALVMVPILVSLRSADRPVTQPWDRADQVRGAPIQRQP